MNPVIPQLILQAFLIILNAVFACAEIAVISMKDARIAQLVSQGDKRALRLARMTSQPARFLATIQVAITLSGFLGSAFAADNFSHMLSGVLMRLGTGIPQKVLDTVSLLLITLVLSYFTLVFGELVPKRVAMKKAEAIALGLSGIISFISKAFAPIVWLLTASTNGILRLFGIDPDSEDEEVTEEEIRMMVDVGSEKGTIDIQEKEIIQNIFEFDDIDCAEIATHRTEITLLWLEESPEQWDETIVGSRHNYYPVCGESADDVTGVLDARDYFRLHDKSRDNVLKEAVRKAYFVPDTLKADVVFANLRKRRDQVAIVLDEYGGMVGIITMNDLLESIVGDLGDSWDGDKPPRPEIEKLDSKTWRISGSANIDEASEALGVKLECDCDTFGGYVMNVLGVIPRDGTTLTAETDQLSIKITKISEHRIESTMVCRIDSGEKDSSGKDETKN